MQSRLPVIGAAIAALTFTLVTGCGTSNQNTTNTANTSSGSPASANNTPANTSSTSSPPQAPKLVTTTKRWSTPPKMMIDPNKQYDAIVHTNFGNFTIHLLAKDSPKTVNNFVFLAKNNFYHDDKFFRIIQSFMIQTGDPNNNGSGGPGYQFADELPPKEHYTPGVVAMANAGPNTNGSQFFIGTGQDVNSLDQQPNYTIFGNVTSGMNVVDKIAAIPVVANPNMQGEVSSPTQVAYIESVDIQEHYCSCKIKECSR
jgi:cyclophilin family peptidyl-prolyl cis-trans isomerase